MSLSRFWRQELAEGKLVRRCSSTGKTYLCRKGSIPVVDTGFWNQIAKSINVRFRGAGVPDLIRMAING